MKTFLIINDNSPEARHAAEFGLLMAQKLEANILLANTFKINKNIIEKVPAGDIAKNDPECYQSSLLPEYAIALPVHLKLLNNVQTGFKPGIEELDASDLDENKLAEIINKNHIWIMIKGIADFVPAPVTQRSLNIHTVLNKVLCPLLLIPASWQLKNIERLVYIADLRYCRIQVVRYLAQLAGPWKADLSIAHLSAMGLPDMAEKYALTVFSEEVCQNVNYDQIFFNNVKEKNLEKAIDVMINGLHNDILVLVNHRFHFEKLFGLYLTSTLPSYITVPLLIFPY